MDEGETKEQFWFNLTANDLKKIMGMKQTKRMLNEIGGIGGLIRLLHSDDKIGLSRNLEDLEQRAMHFGENINVYDKGNSLLHYFIEDFGDFYFVLTLVVGFFSSFFISEIDKIQKQTATVSYDSYAGSFEGPVIAIVLLVRRILLTMTSKNIDNHFLNIRTNMNEEIYCNVLRQGEVLHFQAKHLLTGDIVILKPGDIIYADGLMVDGNIMVKEPPILPFNQDLISKGEEDPFLACDSHVMDGFGKMMVICVGANKENQEDSTKDIFKEGNCKLKTRLIKLMLLTSYSTMTIIFGISASRLSNYLAKTMEKPVIPYMDVIYRCIKLLLLNLVMLLSVAPISIGIWCYYSFMFTIESLQKENVVVKSMKTCETLSSISTILTNKTGSITSNRMSVVESFISGCYFVRNIHYRDLSKRVVELLEDSIGINTNFGSNLIAQKRFQTEPPLQKGNKTECALLGFLADLKINYLVVRKRAPIETIIKVFGTSAKRRIMTTLYSPHPDIYLVLTKGNAKDVIMKCSYIIDQNDDFVPLTENDRREQEEIIYKMSNNSLRTLAMAIREISLVGKTEDKDLLLLKKMIKDDSLIDDSLLTKNMVMLAIFGLEDPLRPDVKEAVELCDISGIGVRMLTEDNLSNARSTALKCAIYKPWRNHVSLDREQFNDLVYRSDGRADQYSLDVIMPYLKVFARIAPEDKLLILNGIKQLAIRNESNEVSAVCGSSLTDGPILKIADIGFALGYLGVETTKFSSNVLLSTDSFVGVMRSIMWGRNMYDTILSVLHLKFTYLLVASFTLLLSVIFCNTLILKPGQLLYHNTLIDSVLAFVLVTHRPSKDIMLKPPYKLDRPLISKSVTRNVLMQALYQCVVVVVILFSGEALLSVDDSKELEEDTVSKHFTLIFHVITLMTIFNSLNSRKTQEKNVFRGLRNNAFFLITWILSFGIQWLVLYYGRMFFYTVPLFIEDWLWCLVFGMGAVLWHQLSVMLPAQWFMDFKMNVTWERLADFSYEMTESEMELNFRDSEDEFKPDRIREAAKAVVAAKKTAKKTQKDTDIKS